MSQNVSLDLISGIHENFARTLERHAEQLADATKAQSEATQHLVNTQAAAHEAQTALNSARSSASKAQEQLNTTAADLSAAIAADVRIDDIHKTLYSLIFSSPQGPDDVRLVMSRTQQAWNTLTERFAPGEPVLYGTPHRWFLAGRIAAQDMLCVDPPRPVPNSLQKWQNGALNLCLENVATGVLSYGYTAYRTLIPITFQSENQVSFLHPKLSLLKWLEQLATNEGPLVIGGEAIADKLDRLDPHRRLVAAAILNASGIEATCELDEQAKEQITTLIVETITLVAVGLYTNKTAGLNKNGLAAVMHTIGLDRQTLETKIHAWYDNLRTNKHASLYHIQSAVLGAANITGILDAIFSADAPAQTAKDYRPASAKSHWPGNDIL